MLGAPGSGKGTQAAMLAESLGVPAISTGEMLRGAVETGTELGARVAEILNSGALVDDATMAQVVRERLSAADAEGGYLLDGYPRTTAQLEALDGILVDRDERLDAVIYIDVPEHELIRRALARQREDDTEEVIQRRLDLYRTKTEPLAGVYRDRELLREIDGDQPIEQVAAAILGVLGAGENTDAGEEE